MSARNDEMKQDIAFVFHSVFTEIKNSGKK